MTEAQIIFPLVQEYIKTLRSYRRQVQEKKMLDYTSVEEIPLPLWEYFVKELDMIKALGKATSYSYSVNDEVAVIEWYFKNNRLKDIELSQLEHGYREGQEHTGKDGKDLIPTLTPEQQQKLEELL